MSAAHLRGNRAWVTVWSAQRALDAAGHRRRGQHQLRVARARVAVLGSIVAAALVSSVAMTSAGLAGGQAAALVVAVGLVAALLLAAGVALVAPGQPPRTPPRHAIVKTPRRTTAPYTVVAPALDGAG